MISTKAPYFWIPVTTTFIMSLILIIAISTFFEYYFGITYRIYLQAEQKTYVISIIQIITYILSVIVIIVLVRVNCEKESETYRFRG